MSTQRISRQDIEEKLRAIEGDVRERLDDSRQKLVAIGAGAAIVLLLLAFLLGRRAGKKKTTFVEIRRR